MYIDNSELQSKLLQGYAGDADAMDDFFSLVLHIVSSHASTHAYLRDHDAVNDFATFCAASIWGQVQRETINPSKNIHAWIIGLAKYRIMDYMRRELSHDARQAAIEIHCREELMADGIIEDETPSEMQGCVNYAL